MTKGHIFLKIVFHLGIVTTNSTLFLSVDAIPEEDSVNQNRKLE